MMRRTALGSARTKAGSHGVKSSAMRREKAPAGLLVDAVGGELGRVELGERDGIAAGFQIGVFEDIADLAVQAAARGADVARIFDVFGMADGAEHARSMISENPITAFKGVRNSWLIWGDELGLGALRLDGVTLGLGRRTSSRASAGRRRAQGS